MSTLEHLSELFGIAPFFYDINGNRHDTPDATRIGMLTAMGLNASTQEAREKTLHETLRRKWTRRLEPVQVVAENAMPVVVALRIPAGSRREEFSWTLTLEDGTRHEGRFTLPDSAWVGGKEIDGRSYEHFEWRLPLLPPLGYHRLRVMSGVWGTGAGTEMTLIVTPGQCHEPENLGWGRKTWGLEIQLYALRSRRNWGIGDLTDLRELVDICADAGAGVIGINPLHALFPRNPAHSSPYSPSSRTFLNPLCLDVEAVPEFAESEAARAIVRTTAFQEKLARLRGEELVDYPAVAALKFAVLEECYRSFREIHLSTNDLRDQAFLSFRQDIGMPLEFHCLYEAIQEHLHAADPRVWGWPVWPEELRHPESDAVHAFAEEHETRLLFWMYLQFETNRQLEAARSRCRERGMTLGLYLDIAVGADRAGSDCWMYQQVFASGVSVGAPPDPFSPTGQNWGFPPMSPVALREFAYEPFIAMVRSAMRHSGAIRLDHVMALTRLFWVPEGGTPANGAYVAYPLADMLAIMALESQRHRCLVVGEDLGTVPDDIRAGMDLRNVYGIKVLLFERNGQRFRSPGEYPWRSAVSASNHDAPTLRGYFEAQDLNIWEKLGRFPSADTVASARHSRTSDLRELLLALEREGLLPGGIDPSRPPMGFSEALMLAIEEYVGRSESKIQLVQLEDVLSQRDQVNLPGTTSEHPNWCRKLPAGIESLPGHAAFQELARRLSGLRPR